MGGCCLLILLQVVSLDRVAMSDGTINVTTAGIDGETRLAWTDVDQSELLWTAAKMGKDSWMVESVM